MTSGFKESKKVFWILLAAMYGIMLLFNILTQKMADDFMYSYSFATWERIEGVRDSIESMIAHGRITNGRYFSHFIAHLCLLLPDIVFDFLNSAVFVSTVYITYWMCNGRGNTNNYLLIGIFGSLWIFELDFAQLNLWLDGSCNYLYALFFGLLFILPYFRSVVYGKKLPYWLMLPHLLLSVWFGGYLEPTTVGFGCAAVLLTATDVFYLKNRRSLWFLPSLMGLAVGFCIMTFAPAQLVNKVSSFSFLNLLTTFGVALLVMACVFPLIIFYVVLLRRAKEEKMDQRTFFTSVIFAISAIAANFVLVVAKYYALRCSVAFVFLSVFATALLFGNLKSHTLGARAVKYGKAFVIVLCAVLLIGIADNAITYTQIERNETVMEDALERGERTVTLYRPVPFTKYNAVWGLSYLNTQDPQNFPNLYISKYYGFDNVYGKSYLEDWFGWW